MFLLAIITLVWFFLANSLAKQGPFKTDTFSLGIFFKRVWEIVVIFLFFFSYLRPFVRTKTGDFTLYFFNSLPTKLIPDKLNAITIRSYFSRNNFLEYFLNISFFERLIFKPEWNLFFDDKFLINLWLYGSVINTLWLLSVHVQIIIIKYL